MKLDIQKWKKIMNNKRLLISIQDFVPVGVFLLSIFLHTEFQSNSAGNEYGSYDGRFIFIKAQKENEKGIPEERRKL